MSKSIDLNNKTVVISRTDSLGDVVLTLPMCGWLKKTYPDCKIIFLGRSYTRPILDAYPHIDEIHAWDEIESLPVQARVEAIKAWEATVFIHVFPDKEISKVVKKAKVPFRIGTSHRSYHLLTCNIKPNFTRKGADEHESQLNFQLLKSYGLKELPTLEAIIELQKDFNPTTTIPEEILESISPNQKKVVLHAKSKGSAKEWSLDNFEVLAKELAQRDYQVFFTGTKQEGAAIRGKIPTHRNIFDVTGQMDLRAFIAFLQKMDGIVACSTGPLHIAASLGVKAIGLYPTQRPMHPGRWRPIGENVTVLVNKDEESKKEQQETTELNIDVAEVLGQF